MGNRKLEEKDIIIVQKMYHISHTTVANIADVFCCSEKTIQYYVDEYPQIYKSVHKKKNDKIFQKVKKTRKIYKPRSQLRSKSAGIIFSLYVKNNLFAIGMTPAQLAIEMGIARQVVYRWLGGGLPSKGNLEKLIEFFNTDHKSLEDIIEDTRYHEKWE